MKTIGMLGGMSWESTTLYYRWINEYVKDALGGLHSAKTVLFSVDFDEIEKLQRAGEWQAAGMLLGEAARSIEAAGADFLVICTNTMHNVAPQIESYISIPILHIADATAHVLVADGIRRVGVLGTRFTMEQSFYTGRLGSQFGIDARVPEASERDCIHRIIYEELCLGHIRPESKARYLDIIDRLAAAGAEAVILGCTEITMLVGQQDTDVPLYDTTRIHAEQAVAHALS